MSASHRSPRWPSVYLGLQWLGNGGDFLHQRDYKLYDHLANNISIYTFWVCSFLPDHSVQHFKTIAILCWPYFSTDDCANWVTENAVTNTKEWLWCLLQICSLKWYHTLESTDSCSPSFPSCVWVPCSPHSLRCKVMVDFFLLWLPLLLVQSCADSVIHRWLDIEPRASHILDKYSTTHYISPFFPFYFETSLRPWIHCHVGWSWTCDQFFSALWVAEITDQY